MYERLEIVIIFPIKPITFGYKSILKTYWLEGRMPSVTHDFYGNELTKDTVTLEHIQPHSKGGLTKLSNLALSKNTSNFKRSNKPLTSVFNKEAFEQYCEQFKNIKLPGFDGNIYINSITRTVNNLLRQGK